MRTGPQGGAGEQLHRGLLVEAAEGAGPHVGDAGERAFGDGEDQAAGRLGEQRVDLLGVGRVVEEEQRPAVGERP
ncbi:hypothetical protein SALBM135S_06180 [Streptomyces alboniger]